MISDSGVVLGLYKVHYHTFLVKSGGISFFSVYIFTGFNHREKLARWYWPVQQPMFFEFCIPYSEIYKVLCIVIPAMRRCNNIQIM